MFKDSRLDSKQMLQLISYPSAPETFILRSQLTLLRRNETAILTNTMRINGYILKYI